MASLSIKPWERVITDIRLVPKLLVLMVFSTIFIVGKQLWDANTLYSSLVSIQKEQVMETSRAEAGILATILQSSIRDGVDGSENAEFAFGVIAKQGDSNSYAYLIELDTGKVLGHPKAKRVSALTDDTDAGKTVSQLIKGLSGELAYELASGDRFEHATRVKGANWVLVSSESTKRAEEHYEAYITHVIWQTVLMIIVFVVILMGAARTMLRQTQFILDSIKTMADKNLAEPVELNCKDEYGDLARELEKTRAQLQDVIKAQVSTSDELSALTEVMTISMSETKESAQEEFAEIDQLASAMSEMTSTVQTVAEHARSASSVTEQASEQARSGQRFVQDTVGKMNELSGDISKSAGAVNQVEERVEAIGSVVGTIQGISEQTNLLALNAAIEAARAGEAGRGFAVVADEVRNLAQRTQNATVEIQDMISQLQESANSAVELMEKSVVEAADGVELVTNAGSELDGIVLQVSNINDMNFQIATAADEQSSVADEMNQNLSNVRELVEASVVVVTELLETSEMMQANAEELDGKIQSFKI
ncbi:methyl-accepting chemotaxis protein [Vibrio sp. JC009]|uniref:methyl-accepting chemotaxis protein n=1 Tax=Vibrio sp. JC009 TaxID=2912314 RepID=UPI0023B0D638|nr:methyl-accepting chemotaxis protein [Vibrio sp. JC009]WED21470.1 methyl-accepting chemotaxis protein [Vibrio sp. JC009]